ncbi:caspase family protein [Flammeovirga sp. OC4]|uniref:caspase family protein n=1 Tax=Flammeovirga sp. OC4 TaxID=1382345 RepID=UPI0009E4244B|nr:caspase family protein [Flammeovirga sp. OC4]
MFLKVLKLACFCLWSGMLCGQTIKSKPALETKNQMPTCLSFSHDGQFLVSGGFNRKVTVFHTDNRVKEIEYKIKDTPLDIKFSYDDNYIISGGKDKLVTVYNTQTKSIAKILKGHKGDVTSVAASQKENIFVSGGKGGKVLMWDLDTDEPIKSYQGSKTEILSVGISPNNKYVVGGDKSGDLYIWELESTKLVTKVEAHKSYIRDLLFSTDSRHIVTCGDDKNIRVWNAKTFELENAYRYHKKWIQTIAISPDNKYLLSGSHDGYVVLSELSTGRIIHKSEKQKNFVLSVDFSEKRNQIASTTLNAKKVYIWDVADLNINHEDVEMMKNMSSKVYALPNIGLNSLPSTTDKQIVQLHISSTSEIPIVSLSISNNTQNLFEYNEMEIEKSVTKTESGYALQLDKSILLNDGVNNISVAISNATGMQMANFTPVNYSKPMARAVPVAATATPVNAKPVAPPSSTNSLYKWALVIGNEHYSQYQTEIESEADVLYASNDAKVFKEVAKKVIGIPEENIIYIENGTYIKMRRGLSKLSKVSAMLKHKMEIYVYYAGHGYPDEETKEPYLIPIDGNGTELEFEGISLKKVYSMLTQHNPKKVTIFIDACFSGGARQSGLVEARGFKVVPKEEKASKNLVVFTASSGKESSLPYKDKEHGLFTYYLTEKIRETNGDISYYELSEYLKEVVGIRSITVNNKPQTPQTNVSPEVGETWKTWRLKENSE